MRGVEELLNFSPGYNVTRESDSGPGTSVSARGRRINRASPNVLFLMDGQRLNLDWTGGALQFNRDLPIGNVERVEVIRGPGSAVYGSNAFVGVVNIVTSTRLNEGYVAAGNLHSIEGYANLSRGGEDWRAALFASGFDDEGQAYFDLEAPPIDETRDPRYGYDAYAVLDWKGLELRLRHQRRHMEDFYVAHRAANGINRFNARHSFASARYQVLDGERYGLALRGSYVRSSGDAMILVASAAIMETLRDQGLTTGAESFLAGPAYEQQEWSAAIEGRATLHPDHILHAGLEFRRPHVKKLANMSNYEVADFLNWAVDPSDPSANIRFYGDIVENENEFGDTSPREIVGVWGEYRFSFFEALVGTLGVRVDHYSDFGTTVNPRLGIAYTLPWTPRYGSSLKLLYGRAFRSPTVNELSASNPVNVGNPDLEPETINTLDVFWLQTLGPVQTTLTWYFSRIQDGISSVPDPNDPDRRTITVNGESEDLSGIEIEMLADLPYGFDFRTAYSYLITRSEAYPRNSRHLLSWSLNYRWRGLHANLNGVHRTGAEQLPAGASTLDGYSVLGAMARYEILNGVRLVARAQNLCDEHYRTPAFDLNYTQGIPNRGRTYQLGIEVALP